MDNIGFRPQKALIINKDAPAEYAEMSMFMIGLPKNIEWLVNLVEQNTEEGFTTNFIT